MHSPSKAQQAVQPLLDLANDKAARGEGVGMANAPEEQEEALKQQRENDERALAGLTKSDAKS